MRAWSQRHRFPDVSKYTVDRLIHIAGMEGLGCVRRTVTTVRAEGKISAKDLLNRNFFTDAPEKVWSTEFTYVPTRNGLTHVLFMIDSFSRRMLLWVSLTSDDTGFVEDALKYALW